MSKSEPKNSRYEYNKPNIIQMFIYNLIHNLRWKFSKQYRIACYLMYSNNTNGELGYFKISTYGDQK